MGKVSEPYHLLIPNSRHPFQTFMMALCLVTGIPLITGQAPAPASMEAALPQWVLIIWGASLVIGSALTLMGSLLNSKVSWLLVEQMGLALVGSAAILYAFIATLTLGFNSGAVIPAGIIVAFGAACFWRWMQIQKFIKSLTNGIDLLRAREVDKS